MIALDLFSGACGGWTLGLHRAGIETVAACEIDPWRRAVYSRNFPHVKMYDDVRTLTAERMRADGLGTIDVLAGSPPCQDASIARRGKRNGIAGEQTGLFHEFIRLVSELRPRWVCAENVPGLVGVGADKICAAVEAQAYRTWVVEMGAEDFGSTCKRRRLWFVALADADQEGLEDAWRQSRAAGQDWIGSVVGGLQAPGNPWLAGEADAVGMAARIPAHVVGGRSIAAYGDAVVPQITEAIGRAVIALDAARAAGVAS